MKRWPQHLALQRWELAAEPPKRTHVEYFPAVMSHDQPEPLVGCI